MLIADSAIEVVARDGVRALTHRAVDSEAGLPSGSTSYYCRTRAQLVALTVERVTSLLRGFVEVSGIQELASNKADDVLDVLSRMIEALLADYRGELAARSALIIELTGREDTTDLVSTPRSTPPGCATPPSPRWICSSSTRACCGSAPSAASPVSRSTAHTIPNSSALPSPATSTAARATCSACAASQAPPAPLHHPEPPTP